MFKLKALFLLVLAFFFMQPALAVDIGVGGTGMAATVGKQAGYNPSATTQYSLAQSIGKVIAGVLAFVSTIFFILAIYAGFLWMTAAGNSEQVEKAQGILKAAAIGMIILMSAYGITAMALMITRNATGFTG